LSGMTSKESRTVLRRGRSSNVLFLADKESAQMDEVNAEPVVYRWKYKMDEIQI